VGIVQSSAHYSPIRPYAYMSESFESTRLAVPRRGHVLSRVVESYSAPIREAVVLLSSVLQENECARLHRSLLSPRREDKIATFYTDLVAWSLVSMWVTGLAADAFSNSASLRDAELWFLGSGVAPALTLLPAEQTLWEAEDVLRRSADASAYRELLPYLLDPHGPGSRMSVRRNPSTRTARTRKRTEGVFYTPIDVAEYMATVCFDTLEGHVPPTVFEPACGTGVFLRTALKEIKIRHPEYDYFSLASKYLFGADIDPWALDATAFALLSVCWNDLHGSARLPADIWRRLRLNLAVVDALLLDPLQHMSVQCSTAGRVSLSTLFPTLHYDPRIIIGNPPYADLGPRTDLAELTSIFKTISVKPNVNAEIYLSFIEQMIRLADESLCSCAFVLPLSIACNGGSQFAVMRNLIASTRGSWKFAFFDREPHALFGEDVKTRNAIMLWSRKPTDQSVEVLTGPLQKWRSESRAAMFKSLNFTPLDAGIDISLGIPKVEGEVQSRALKILFSRKNAALGSGVHICERFRLSDTVKAISNMVFIGPTAYNFLNIFLKPDKSVIPDVAELSEHHLHAIRCPSGRDAFAVFAIFSSHLAYWWWRIQGDGFHVLRRFIGGFPFCLQPLPNSIIEDLAHCGNEMWTLIKDCPIISINRAKTSLAFTPKGHDDIRRRVDQLLADVAGLEPLFVDELQQFTAHTVTATLRNRTLTETIE